MALIPFDDRDGTIWLNGEMLPWRDAKTHTLSHGLHYASLVFEGERVYSGTIFKGREHTERLRNSCKIMDFDDRFTHAVQDTAVQCNHMILLCRFHKLCETRPLLDTYG